MTRQVKSCKAPSQCRSCKRQVLWVEWAGSGKKMPVDEAPDPNGKVVVSHRAAENKLIAEQFDATKHQGRRRFTSHFSTCPNADQHRSSR